MRADLCEISSQFLLGIYRNAVELYQPLIEKRTGVSLGPIHVRDYRQIDSDCILAMKQTKHPWWYRLFRRSVIEEQFRQFCQQLLASRAERSRACMACYYRKTIYVNFAHGSLCHQEGLAFTTVHELAHALWETIAEQALDQGWPESVTEQQNYQLLAEGYATYAEQVWFKDLYPAGVRDRVDHTKEAGGIYDRGRHRIAELVDQYGSEVLLVIPKRWSDFCG
jgi:hypothetical protein